MKLYSGGRLVAPESAEGRITGVVLGLMFLFFGLMAWVLADGRTTLLPVLVGIPIALFGISMLVRALRTPLVARSFERFEVDLPQGALLESTVTGSISLAPKKPLEVVGATVSVLVEESMLVRRRLKSRFDGDRSVIEPVFETVHMQAQSLAVPASLSEPFDLSFELKLPPNVPPTLWGQQGAVKTQVEVTIDLKNQPSVSVKRELIVRAERAR